MRRTIAAMSDGADSQKSRHVGKFEIVFPAMVGLLGVLVGTLATAYVTWRGDNAHRKADKREAIRLISNEIRQDTNSLTQIARTGKLTGGRPPQTVYWNSEAGTLARAITSEDWRDVSNFYDDVLNIQPSIAAGKGGETRSYAKTVACEGNAAFTDLVSGPPLQSVQSLNCNT